MRTFYIHVGGPKTGSSALQDFFIRNKCNLEEQGVKYRVSTVLSEDEVSCGNGVKLFSLFFGMEPVAWFSMTVHQQTQIKLPDARLVCDLVEWYFSDKKLALCSSEFLSLLDESMWCLLRDCCSSLNISMKVIHFIRDPISYYIAAYDQVIKNHGYSCAFNEFVNDSRWDHYISVSNVVSVLPSESVCVLDYCVARNNLIGRFMDLIGLPSFVPDQTSSLSTPVNRSLSDVERRVLIRINDILGAKYGSDMSRRLVSELKFKPGGNNSILTEEVIDLILFKERNEVVFFANEFGVNYASTKSLHMASLADNLGEIKDAHASLEIVVDWLINFIGKNFNNICLVDRLCALMKNPNPVSLSLPDGFDPVAYLLLNRDLIEAGVDPFDHYISIGYLEGRDYKSFINRVPSASYEKLLKRLDAIENLNP